MRFVDVVVSVRQTAYIVDMHLGLSNDAFGVDGLNLIHQARVRSAAMVDNRHRTFMFGGDSFRSGGAAGQRNAHQANN
jgi:hypothetical protein